MMSEMLCEKLVTGLDDLKANDIKVLDVKGLASFTDTMIIASGRSSTHVRALAEKIIEIAKSSDFNILGSEGQEQGEWILVDIGDIVVHVMQQTTRDNYQLEKLWSVDNPDAKSLSS